MRTSQSEISTPLSLMLTPTNNLLPAVSMKSGAVAETARCSVRTGISFAGATGGCGSRATAGVCGDRGRVDVPIAECVGLPPARWGGGPSTVLTVGFTSTEPSRRPIPSMSFLLYERAVNDDVIIRLDRRLRNRVTQIFQVEEYLDAASSS